VLNLFRTHTGKKEELQTPIGPPTALAPPGDGDEAKGHPAPAKGSNKAIKKRKRAKTSPMLIESISPEDEDDAKRSPKDKDDVKGSGKTMKKRKRTKTTPKAKDEDEGGAKVISPEDEGDANVISPEDEGGAEEPPENQDKDDFEVISPEDEGGAEEPPEKQDNDDFEVHVDKTFKLKLEAPQLEKAFEHLFLEVAAGTASVGGARVGLRITGKLADKVDSDQALLICRKIVDIKIGFATACYWIKVEHRQTLGLSFNLKFDLGDGMKQNGVHYIKSTLKVDLGDGLGDRDLWSSPLLLLLAMGWRAWALILNAGSVESKDAAVAIFAAAKEHMTTYIDMFHED